MLDTMRASTHGLINNRLRGATTAERLDMALINCKWTSSLSTRIDHLSRACSDHSPLLITAQLQNTVGTCFRFINAWITRH